MEGGRWPRLSGKFGLGVVRLRRARGDKIRALLFSFSWYMNNKNARTRTWRQALLVVGIINVGGIEKTCL